MADAAVGFLLEQVSGVIKGYADLISGAGKEFEGLKKDVSELKDLLKDIASASSEEQRVIRTQNKIREVVYEVEDTIDTWLTQEAALKAKSKINRCFIWLHPNHISLAKQVKSLRKKEVKEMVEKASQIASLVGTGNQEQAKEMKVVRTIRKDKVVRLIDTEDNIIGQLTTEQRELDIIPIIGMPGLGKTTAAWKIFNHERVRLMFPIRIWVHFSQRFNTRDVLLQILRHFSNNYDELSSYDDQRLSSETHECLNKETFLLVMDDVWNINDWNDIQNALPYENGNGKVLITSRDMEVGRHVKRITKRHNPLLMRFLTEQESWELLQLEVFGNLESCPKELQDIGKLIAEDCKGVPLTIVVIGGVLKDSYWTLENLVLVNSKWEEIAKNEHLKLLSNDRVKMINEVVALSYHGLPDYLKECFLYLGVFPAGYEIPAWTLMWLWIVEGFIQPDDKKTLEEIAEDYLNYLISKSLLMVHKINPMKKVKVCWVHDIIRVFCITKAAEHNLFKEVTMSEEKKAALPATEMEKIHRLCLHSGLNKFFSANLKGPHVRSFLSFRMDVVDLESKYNSAIPENYLLLRILHFKSIKFNQFPLNVSKLSHLRYIVICVADLKILPQSLSQLWNLQIITVDTNSESLKMEANIWKMIRLRHVRTKSAIVLNKAWQGEAGENLQTLNRLSPESVTSAISQKASNLKTLGIRGDLGPFLDSMTLEKMTCLEKLKLYQAATSENRLQRFPDRNLLPQNLKRLTLSKTLLDWKHMSTLANIPDLEVLKLKDNAFTGIRWEAQNLAFNKLQVLHILNSDLFIWKASDSTFPCLRHLELKKCEKLRAIPDAIEGRLKNLEIGGVRKSISCSATKRGISVKVVSDLIDKA